MIGLVFGLPFRYGVYLRYCQRFITILLQRICNLILSSSHRYFTYNCTLLIPIQTSTEEYVLEVLMQGFGNLSGNKWFPLFMTSLIFWGMHF
jgi:hypothetical protein